MNILEFFAVLGAYVTGILLPMFWDNSPLTSHYNDEVDL